MGGGASFKPFPLPFYFLFLTLVLSAPRIHLADADTEMLPPSSPLPPPPPPTSDNSSIRVKNSSLKPSIAVLVGIVTTIFSVTFLLLLYVKHCKRGNVAYSGNPNSRGPHTPYIRKNSGIDRAVIESLPIFRFGSLRGQKDGLECAVCLNRFDYTEVLRLLPKCKHAFHVECVDTWLDAHSTCPLCRHRVDPEDILLLQDVRILPHNQTIPPPQESNDSEQMDLEIGRNGTEPEVNPGLRRVSGRHSSVGERDGFLQIILQKTGTSELENESTHQNTTTTTSLRRSLDSASTSKKKSESMAVGCFDRPRKDGLLLTADKTRLEHRIIVSPGPLPSGLHQRWSDVQASDLLYLTSEMIINDGRRFSSPLRSRRQNMPAPSSQLKAHGGGTIVRENHINEDSWSGRDVINSRSVSEITGVSRFPSSRNRNTDEGHYHVEEQQRERQAGLVLRWLAWISQSQPAVR